MSETGRLSTWGDVWDVLNETFVALAAELVAVNPGLHWTVDHYENESFPLRGYLSFSGRGTAGEEDVVIMVQVHRRDDSLRWTSDIANGDGEVLAEGPTHEAAVSTQLARWVADALQQTLEFLSQSRVLLSDLARP